MIPVHEAQSPRLSVLADYLLERGVAPQIVAVLVDHGYGPDRPHSAWEALAIAWELALAGDPVCIEALRADARSTTAARIQVAIGLLTPWADDVSTGQGGVALRSLAHRVRGSLERREIRPYLLAPSLLHASRSGDPALWPRALRAVRGVLTRLDLWAPSPVVPGEDAWACPVCGGPLIWHVADTRSVRAVRPAQAHCVSGASSSLSAQLASEDVCPWTGARCETTGGTPGLRWAGGAE